MKFKILPYCYLLIVIFSTSCRKESKTLFRLLPSQQTGISFSNKIPDSDTFNILTHEYIYNGGGVGIADFNNDGLQDIFFSGNIVENKLYLNEGNLKFKDVTAQAGVNESGRWNSGVAIVDINNDGFKDIYVCATMHTDSSRRKNMLFINKGVDKSGVPSFANEAHQYGIDGGGYSVAAAFFDYDRDTDLDLYLLINERMDNFPTNYRPKITDGSAPNNDRLYRNNNNGTFTEVTKEAGITIEGFGLGLSITDINLDGWSDIYVSNDYLSNDILYVNNKDGTFSNRIAEFITHQSQFSMGNDAADINNDARPDIITVDMLPETSDRKKTTIGNKSYLTYINNQKFGYEQQYVRNMLHINNGADAGIKFSEVGQLSGIYQTEWSWSPLFADFNNDGYKDLIITNGFPKDITDKDFANYRADVGNIASIGLLEDSIPTVKISNYVFENNGDLTFTDRTKSWGLYAPSFSNGASFSDLDNDGDLDYVINNINDEAFVFENTLYNKEDNKDSSNNYIRIKLSGEKNKINSIGAKVTLYTNNTVQYYDNNIYRGFLSSVEDVIHFGLGKHSTVDSIIVQWPSGDIQKEIKLPVNKTTEINYKPNHQYSKPSYNTLLVDASSLSQLFYKHEEKDKIDYNLQRTLPHKFSQYGPGLACGDINGDHLEDLVIGGSAENAITTFIQKENGSFKKINKIDKPIKDENLGLLLFDCDGDKDLDLYAVSGSIENAPVNDYPHRLYTNDGKGNFALSPNGVLADINVSGSCVRAADLDGDNDLDLFVGGRVYPAAYPLPVNSYILENREGKFFKANASWCPDLDSIGMVTDALWTDFNKDGKVDLMLTGEFMPVTMFKNDGRKLTRVTSNLDNYKGWWNSLQGGDFDRDGDTDYIAGNLGVNNNYQITNNYPLKIFARDFDGNGSIDPVLACYMRTSMESDKRDLYPIHFWDEINSQSPFFRRKFTRYKQYSKAKLEDVLSSKDLQGALILEANSMHTSYIENLGDGTFNIRPLPIQCQVAPVYGMVVEDFNEDGNLDVMMVGNDYGNEVFAGQYDAFTGLILLGDGQGRFKVLSSAESGLYIPGDAKALVKLALPQSDYFIASQNKDTLKVFVKNHPVKAKSFLPEPFDASADLIYNDGKIQHLEFYYGAGYLSQSTRRINIPNGVREIVVKDYGGKARRIAIANL